MTGVGSAKDPYVVKATRQTINNQLQVADTPSLDLTLAGSGTVGDPYIISGVSSLVVATGTWNPTISGLVLGSGGTSVGSYRQVGKRVHAKLVITLGTSPTVPTKPTIPLPIALPVAADAQGPVGDAGLYDTSATSLFLGKVLGNGDTANVTLYTSGSPMVPVGSLAPFTWAVGDKIVIELDYTGV